MSDTAKEYHSWARYCSGSSPPSSSASRAHAPAGQQPALPGADGPRLPGVPGYARPATTALEVNAKLKALHEELSASRPGTPIRRAHVDALLEELTILEGVDKLIQQLAPGVGEEDIRCDALRNRALAWLHGWALFSNLAERASHQGNDEQRQRLLGTDTRSALGLLLRVFAQMRKAEATPAEPLRIRLATDT